MKTKKAVTTKQVGYKSIVVAVDFSDTSIKALEYAVALAREFGSRLRLIHILEFPAVFNSPKPVYAQWDKRVKEAATQRLAELMAQKVDAPIAATAEVRSGRAYQAICETASKQKANLIVMGTHGFTGLKHIILGSTAERVIRHAPCSVLILRPQFAKNPKAVVKPRKILVPTDFSKPAEEAFRTAIVLAKQNQAQVQLLYVVPVYYAAGEYDAIDYSLLEAEDTELAEKRLATLGKILTARKIPFKSEIRRGRIAVEVNETAAAFGADLVVIATHGRTGWQHVMLGSTTEEVVRHSLCPVLVVRKP